MNKKIIIIDFGSQTCHLISRRFKDMGLEVDIVDPEAALKQVSFQPPAGIVFSGGPASVYDKKAPRIDKKIFNLNIPILGICYGWQLTAYLMGGKVLSGNKEYGPATLELGIQNQESSIFYGIPEKSTVWVSHGDTVVKLPAGFTQIGSTENVNYAAVENKSQKIFGVQFHPEVEHTVCGQRILRNFAENICALNTGSRTINVNDLIEGLKKHLNGGRVVCAVSGGVDSTVAAVLVGKAIGKNLYPIYIDSGLMRPGTAQEVEAIFYKCLKIKPLIVSARKLFLTRLKGIRDGEKKRKIIGKLYIDLFEREAKKIKDVRYLVQGTIYSDVIESAGTKHASRIKSHHNVGGLPAKMNLKLVEPLRFYYKDQVRQLAAQLDLPLQVVNKQPFPGPGNAIRIIGEITEKRLAAQNRADLILCEELQKAGWWERIFQSFPVMTGAYSTAVKGDQRALLEVVALRIYTSSDIMTTDWAKIPYEVLQKISSRIVNEIPDISRVVYDITTKPPATMEWE